MKKSKVIGGILTGLITLFMAVTSFVPLVSAYYLPTVRDGSQLVVDTVVDFLEPILQAIFGGTGGVWNADLLFGKLLLFLIILSVVYVALKKFPGIERNTGILWLVTVVVALLSVRYLDYNMMELALFQYKVLGIVLSTILPFIIFFFFLHSSITHSPPLRKLGWILFFLVYVGLWSTSNDEFMSMIYFWAFIAAIVMIFADQTVSNMFIDVEAKRANSMQIRLLIQELTERKKDITDAPYSNEKDRHRDLKDVQNTIIQLYKQLSN